MDGFTAVVLLIGAGIIAAMMLLVVVTAQRYARPDSARGPGVSEADVSAPLPRSIGGAGSTGAARAAT